VAAIEAEWDVRAQKSAATRKRLDAERANAKLRKEKRAQRLALAARGMRMRDAAAYEAFVGGAQP
jgi:hypothetical protein